MLGRRHKHGTLKVETALASIRYYEGLPSKQWKDGGSVHVLFSG